MWQGFLRNKPSAHQHPGRGTEGRKKEITLGRKGRRHGEQKNLTEEQERHIQKAHCRQDPDQLKFPFALWTREAVREIIHRQCALDMPVRTVGEYLKRWGLLPKKPVKRANRTESG